MYSLQQLTLVASAESEQSQGLFSALGIDVVLLVQQALGFLVLVFLLARFVYPALMRAVDDRREQIESGIKEAKLAEEKLASAEEKVSDVLAEARGQADEMLARTQADASALLAEAEGKAKIRAEQIVADAHAQLEADVRKARAALKAETIEIVTLATEKVVHEKLNSQSDAKLITKALEGQA